MQVKWFLYRFNVNESCIYNGPVVAIHSAQQHPDLPGGAREQGPQAPLFFLLGLFAVLVILLALAC